MIIIVNERGLSLQILMDITKENGYNNIVLKKTLAQNSHLRREQKAFVTEAVNGTLRHLIFLDYIINRVSKTNTRQMEPQILNLLRLSVYQLKFMDKIPQWSVCDEAVKLAAESGFEYLKGFINGVLRNIIRNMPDILASVETIKESDYTVYLEIKYSCPRFLARRLVDYLGAEDAERTLKSSLERDWAVTIRANTLKTTMPELIYILKKEKIEVLSGKFARGSLRLRKTSDLTKLKAFQDGLFHVMDESAMLAVQIAGVKPGGSFLDVCAAPGGKSFMAAYEAGSAGIIDARDVYPHKIKLIEEGCARLGLDLVKPRLMDACAKDETSIDAFDTVLVDAPCSGFGLIGKKPEIKYNKSDKVIMELQSLQRRILSTSCDYVKPGGTLIYCTCTLTPEENEENADWFTENFNFERADISGLLPDGINETSPGQVRILPYEFGTDGFFIAKFIRKA